MKCEIVNGLLTVLEPNPTETYALKKWAAEGGAVDLSGLGLKAAKPETLEPETETEPKKVDGGKKKADTVNAEVADENDEAGELSRDELKAELHALGVEFNPRLRVPALVDLLKRAKALKAEKPKNHEKVMGDLKAQAEETPAETPKEEKREGASAEAASEIDIFDIEPKEEKKLAVEDIREALISFAKKHGKTAAVALINDFGASCVSEIKAADYSKVYEKAIEA